MEIDVITSLIQSVGFPIFVAVYLLISQSKQLNVMKEIISRVETSINMQTQVMTSLISYLKSKNDKAA